MLVGHVTYDPQFGFSITSPFKKVGRGIATGARAVGRGAKAVGKVAYKPIEYGIVKPAEWLGNKLMAPVKNRVQKIVHRRAAKLAYDRRKSTTPTPGEITEARNWTRSKLRGELPHGPVLSVFAGAGPVADHELGIAPAVAAAAVPVLVAFAQSLLSRFSNSGEAPANPGADAKADATAPDAPVPAGTVDLQPAQDAAQNAVEAATTAVDKAAHPGMVKLPAVGYVKKSHVMIGGAVLGGVILLSLLTRKG